MPVEFIGALATREDTEVTPPTGPIINRDYVRMLALAQEAAGFDRVLIAWSSSGPDNAIIASQMFNDTRRLGVLLARRPGFISPTLEARTLATIDHFSEGRMAVHIVSGGSDSEQRRDGDYLGHDERYRRTAEHLEILKRVWSSNVPIDHQGPIFRFSQAFSAVKPLQKPHPPVYFGGSSPAAIAVAGQYADVYALWGESLEGVRETLARVAAVAATHGRANRMRFMLSIRVILGRTEAEAWNRAEDILSRAKHLKETGGSGYYAAAAPVTNVGSSRLLDMAAKGRVVDKRLWTEIATLTGARGGNCTALVGTPEQVVESLMEYYEVGVSVFLIRGFWHVQDALELGREVIPRMRAEVARRDAAAGGKVGEYSS
jgi:alkanesulfonate monooxygenase